MKFYRWFPSLLALCLAPACLESGQVLGLNGSAPPKDGGSLGNGGSAGAGSPPNSTLVPAGCEAPADSSAVPLCAATYLGTASQDSLAGVALSSRGTVVVAAQLGSDISGIPQETLSDAGGSLALLELTEGGRELVRSIRLGTTPGPLESDPERKRILVGSGRELFVVQDDLQSIVWQHTLDADLERFDVDDAGTVATLSTSGEIRVYDAAGSELGVFSLADPVVEDVAVSSEHGLVYVVGAHDDPSMECLGRIPFLRAYDFSGTVSADAYDFDSADGWCASTVGRRVTFGPDGFLYYGGENQGGNTVHLRDPHNLDNQAPLVSYDQFNQGHGMAIEWYGFVARFEPTDLTIERGQLVLPRDEEDIGGEYRIRDLKAGSEGQLAILGRSTCCIENRDALTVAGSAVGPYAEPELAVAVLNQDFSSRHVWFTPTTDSRGGVEPSGLAWRGGLLAVTASLPASTGLATHQAEWADPLGESDGYLLTFREPF